MDCFSLPDYFQWNNNRRRAAFCVQPSACAYNAPSGSRRIRSSYYSGRSGHESTSEKQSIKGKTRKITGTACSRQWAVSTMERKTKTKAKILSTDIRSQEKAKVTAGIKIPCCSF